MFSIRNLARSAPRAVSRVTCSAVLQPARRPAVLSSFNPARTQFATAFSTSTSRRATEGEVDEELVAKFVSELEMEQEMREGDEIPTSVKDYLENGPFEIQDTPGHEEVVLTRKFGDETIKVTFSIADLNNIDPEADYEDRAMSDEEVDPEDLDQSSKPSRAASEDASAANGDENFDGSEESESFPARLQIVISKPNSGALAIESVAQDGLIVIDNVYYYPSADLANPKTAELDHKRQNMYVGPPFGNLDPDLQVMFERYLDERGINTALALFVPDYIDVKEQREYLRWLESVKGFVEA